MIIHVASYWPDARSWRLRRWGKDSYLHDNLMWNQPDEDWFQKRTAECIIGSGPGQPKSRASWKKFGPGKCKFDIPYENYCAEFLKRVLG